MKTLVLSVLSFTLLVLIVSGCAPAPASIPSPVPIDFKRITLNEFNPDLIVSLPISFEIPKDYILTNIEFFSSSHFWMPADIAKVSQTKNEKPDTSFLEAAFTQNVGYDSVTDKFLNSINDMNDKKSIEEYKAAGATVNNVERVNVGEFPILILELDIPYGDTVRKVHFVYIASLIETNVVMVRFYFSLPLNPSEDYIIWQHFRNSLEGKSGARPTPLVPFITTTP